MRRVRPICPGEPNGPSRRCLVERTIETAEKKGADMPSRLASPPTLRFTLLAVAVALAAFAAFAVPPAPAQPPTWSAAGREYTLDGRRTALRVDVAVTDPAPAAYLQVAARFGEGGFSVRLSQDGARKRDRSLGAFGMNRFRNIDGRGCTFEPFGDGSGALVCEQKAYDWVVGRTYRISFQRGAKNANGWRWVVRIRDLRTGVSTKVASFRLPNGRLGLSGNDVRIDTFPASCGDLERVAATARTPVAARSTVAWGPRIGYSPCPGTVTRTSLSGGQLTMVVR
jgi:hypothetical protein